ncbi:hypothetical protein BafHLJ01_0878 [Borreliella afzelii HLJ01]|nr:hypothetical protein BafHLJ01_0878 [Borreliella afzelii HLJ01]
MDFFCNVLNLIDFKTLIKTIKKEFYNLIADCKK